MRATQTCLAVALLSTALGGCANKNGFVSLHGDEFLPPSQLSILRGVYEYRNGSAANETIRIVQVDGKKIPNEFGVAEGANFVSLLPGLHDVKLLWVHANGPIDYYSYSTIRIDAQPNCIYQFYSKFSVGLKEVYIDVLGSPASKDGNQGCDSGVVLPDEPQST